MPDICNGHMREAEAAECNHSRPALWQGSTCVAKYDSSKEEWTTRKVGTGGGTETPGNWGGREDPPGGVAGSPLKKVRVSTKCDDILVAWPLWVVNVAFRECNFLACEVMGNVGFLDDPAFARTAYSFFLV